MEADTEPQVGGVVVGSREGEGEGGREGDGVGGGFAVAGSGECLCHCGDLVSSEIRGADQAD